MAGLKYGLLVNRIMCKMRKEYRNEVVKVLTEVLEVIYWKTCLQLSGVIHSEKRWTHFSGGIDCDQVRQ